MSWNMAWRRWKWNIVRHFIMIRHLIKIKKYICYLFGNNPHYLWPKFHNISTNIRLNDDVNLTQLINIALLVLHSLKKITKWFLENIRRPNPSELYERLSENKGGRENIRSVLMNTRENFYYSHSESGLSMVEKVLAIKRVLLVWFDSESFDWLIVKEPLAKTRNPYQDKKNFRVTVL